MTMYSAIWRSGCYRFTRLVYGSLNYIQRRQARDCRQAERAFPAWTTSHRSVFGYKIGGLVSKPFQCSRLKASLLMRCIMLCCTLLLALSVFGMFAFCRKCFPSTPFVSNANTLYFILFNFYIRFAALEASP